MFGEELEELTEEAERSARYLQAKIRNNQYDCCQQGTIVLDVYRLADLKRFLLFVIS